METQNYNIIPTSYVYKKEEDYNLIIKKYIEVGISSIRINCTRFSLDEYCSHVSSVRNVFRRYGKNVNIMIDLPYPGRKMRIEFGGENDYFQFVKGHKYYFVKNKSEINGRDKLWVDSKSFYMDYCENELFILGDGEVTLRFLQHQQNSIEVLAENTGSIMYKKSIYTSCKYCEKASDNFELNDYVKFLKITKPESVILSFVECSDDISQIKQKIDENNMMINIISKLETLKGIKAINEILEVSDGIMLGRGDLGLTSNLKEFGECCLAFYNSSLNNKRIIVATDILNSLNQGIGIPNRAELLDVFFMKKYGIREFVASSTISNDEEQIHKFKNIVSQI